MDTNFTIIQMDDSDDPTFQGRLSFWINGVLSLTLVAIGTMGNSAIVLSLHCCRNVTNPVKKRRQAFYFYLMTFAFWNTGLLIATVLFNCIPALFKRNSDFMAVSNISHLIGYLWGNCCLTANIWLAVVVTIERFRAVSLPFHSTRLTSPRRRAKLVSIFLSIGAIIYNSPLLFELTLNPRYEYTSSRPDQPRLDTNRNNTMEINLNKNVAWPNLDINLNKNTPWPNLDTNWNKNGLSPNLDISNQTKPTGLASSLSNGLNENKNGKIMKKSGKNRTGEIKPIDMSIVASMLHEGYQLATPIYELRMSTLRDNVYYQFVYRILGNMLFVSGLPFLVVLLLTIKIVWVVRESDRQRERFRKPTPTDNHDRSLAINNTKRKRSSSTSTFRSRPTSPVSARVNSIKHAHVVLTLIAAKFLLCYSLPVVINIFELTIDKRKFESEKSGWSKALAILVDLSNLLVVLDAATNAFFYFSWWRKRIRLKERFGRKKNTENNSLMGNDIGDTMMNGNVGKALRQCRHVSIYRKHYQPHLLVPSSPCYIKNSASILEKDLIRKGSAYHSQTSVV